VPRNFWFRNCNGGFDVETDYYQIKLIAHHVPNNSAGLMG
jgi:hypothetical protein